MSDSVVPLVATARTVRPLTESAVPGLKAAADLAGKPVPGAGAPALQRILYVEDDPDIRTIATLALTVVGGLTLEVCRSGAEALARAGSFQADLLLLDVMMPDMDGPETLARLRLLPPTAATPAVFMTAKVQSSEVAHFMSLGALGVISKPFDPMLLAQQLRTLWAGGAA